VKEFVRPIVVISRCIEFEPCRYDGRKISSPFVDAMKDYAVMHPVCPEVEIGLGVPRDPLRLVEVGEKPHLVQPTASRDLTSELRDFSDLLFKTLPSFDGAILKDRSPSCGPGNAAIFADSQAKKPLRLGDGLFASAIRNRYPHIAIADERQLRDPRQQDHFLTTLFLLAEFRAIRNHEITKNLLQFHAEHKYLLTAYHRKEFATLTRLITNREDRPFDLVVRDYQEHLYHAIARPPRTPGHVAVLRHALTHLDSALTPDERSWFEETVEAFRAGTAPLSRMRIMFRDWIVKYDEDYLVHQSYFEPYPADLESL
jgi:uncharacterized protein YbgA (DUF1722 family)/uncharacterized protein YbbK (DUF523 family)